ncbi:MAG TPA: hypothetical protein VHK70_06470 [Burkholderiaceae bacterium]|nr:hypothetical protein [Burkholderiaceae bacterium]
MFQFDRVIAPLVYSPVFLTKALREGSMELVEYAPLCERAKEGSILIEAESLQVP